MSNESFTPSESSQPHPLSLARAWDPNVWIPSVHSALSSTEHSSPSELKTEPHSILTCGIDFWNQCHDYKKNYSWFSLEKISDFILTFIQNPSLWFYKMDKQQWSMIHLPLIWCLMNALYQKTPVRIQNFLISQSESLMKNEGPNEFYSILKNYHQPLSDGHQRFFLLVQIENAFKKNALEELILVTDVALHEEHFSLQQCFFIPSYVSSWHTQNQGLDKEDPLQSSVPDMGVILGAKAEELYEAWMKASFRVFRPRHLATRQLDEAIRSYSLLASDHPAREADVLTLLDKLVLLERVYFQTGAWLQSRRYLSSRSTEVWAVRRWSRQRFNILTRMLIEKMYFSEPAGIQACDPALLSDYYHSLSEVFT